MPKRLLARAMERSLHAVIVLCAGFAVLVTMGLALYLVAMALPALPAVLRPEAGLSQYSWETSSVGVLPMVYGTLWTSLCAVLFTFPFALGSAILLTQWPSRWTRVIEDVIHVGGRIPAIVVGLFGAAFIVPLLARMTGGRISFSGFAGVAVLCFMTAPMMTSLMIRHIRRVPQRCTDGSYSLGASACQTIRLIVLPAAARGILTVPLLALARAASEAMALLLVLGNVPQFRSAGVGMLSFGMRTIATSIMQEMTSMAIGGKYFEAIFVAAFLLTASTWAMHIAVRRIQRKAAMP